MSKNKKKRSKKKQFGGWGGNNVNGGMDVRWQLWWKKNSKCLRCIVDEDTTANELFWLEEVCVKGENEYQH